MALALVWCSVISSHSYGCVTVSYYFLDKNITIFRLYYVLIFNRISIYNNCVFIVVRDPKYLLTYKCILVLITFKLLQDQLIIINKVTLVLSENHATV